MHIAGNIKYINLLKNENLDTVDWFKTRTNNRGVGRDAIEALKFIWENA